jgi:hypothetical protein
MIINFFPKKFTRLSQRPNGIPIKDDIAVDNIVMRSVNEIISKISASKNSNILGVREK